MDHQEFLGNSIKKIAFEKSGIIKENSKVIIAKQKNDALKVIKNEANNGLSNERGTIAMARTNDPHSASAQFFINLKDNNFLDFTSETIQGWGYCVFGKVIAGMDIVDKIAQSKTSSYGPHQDVPEEQIIISEIIIE